MAERSIAVRLLADVANYVQGLGRAKAATGDLINELSKSEQARANFQQLGTTMAVAGAGIAAGIGLATKAAVDWETAWAGVAKTVDGSEAELAMLEEELRAMARELPATHTEIAAVAEAAGQLGIATGDITDFTRVMIQLGTATNLTAEEAAVALAQMANVMGTSTDDIDNLGASLVDLGNNSATTERDILEMAQRIAGAGATIGLTESDVLAFSAALASVGINAEAGGSAISRAMIDIESRVRAGGAELADLAKVAGVSAEEFAAAYEQDAAQAIATFIAGLGRMQDSGEDVFAVLDQLGFSEIRLRDALLRLASSGDLLTRSLDTGAQAWDENLALAEEAERRYGTTAAQLQIAKNNINDLAITLGETFLPVLGDVATRVSGLADFFAGLPGPVQSVVGVLAALTAGVLLLGGTALIAVPKVAALKASLDQLAASGGVAGAAATRLRTGLGSLVSFLGGPWGIAIAAATVAMGVWANEHAKANARAEEVIATLDEQTGAITDNTRAWVANQLEQEGVLDAARQMGIQLDDLVDAALGDEDAVRRVNAQLREFAGASENVAVVLETENGQVEVSTRLLEELGIEVEQAQAKKERLEEATGRVTDAEGELADQSDTTGDAIAGVGDEAAGAAEEVEELREAFDELFDVQMSADRALIEYKRGLRELKEAIDGGSSSLNVNTEAGQDNRDMVLDQVEAIKELRDANIDQGMSIDDANEKYEKQLDKLEELLIQQGFNEEAVRDLIDSYRDIPEQVDTEVRQPGMTPALDDVDELKRRYHDLPKRKETRIRTPGFGVVVDAVREYARMLAQIPSSVHTNITGSGPSRPGIQERWGGVTLRAQRGLLRADIFPPTAPARYAFAEPETGGEAFIPRRGDRERSLAILSTAAGWYGARVVGGDGPGVGGRWQWHGQRSAAAAAGSGTGDSGGVFEGTLVLDSGELLGVVRGEIREHDRNLRQRVGAGPRRRV